jgi:hypothetical protein
LIANLSKWGGLLCPFLTRDINRLDPQILQPTVPFFVQGME